MFLWMQTNANIGSVIDLRDDPWCRIVLVIMNYGTPEETRCDEATLQVNSIASVTAVWVTLQEESIVNKTGLLNYAMLSLMCKAQPIP